MAKPTVNDHYWLVQIVVQLFAFLQLRFQGRLVLDFCDWLRIRDATIGRERSQHPAAFQLLVTESRLAYSFHPKSPSTELDTSGVAFLIIKFAEPDSSGALLSI